MTGTKTAQTLATKAKLEQVAQELFAERGFADVSAEEVAAKAGVTRGALYHHYDGKEGLFTAVVEAAMQELHAKLAAEAATVSDPLAALERGIHVFLEVCSRAPVQKILLIDAPAVLGWVKWREMDAKYGLGLLKRALLAAQAAGRLENHDAELLAHLLLGALIEAAMLIARSTEQAKTQGSAEKAIATLIDSWKRPRGAA
jgi:AcrR family transcriptional regulator